MAKKLFVGSLAYSVTDDELRKVFEEVGPVDSATVVWDRQNNRSRGIGFVEMTNDEDADKAVKELNNRDVSGRPIKVEEARPREERPAA